MTHTHRERESERERERERGWGRTENGGGEGANTELNNSKYSTKFCQKRWKEKYESESESMEK